MCQVNLGLLPLYILASLVGGVIAADEGTDSVPTLSRGPRHRLHERHLGRKQKKKKGKPKNEDTQSNDDIDEKGKKTKEMGKKKGNKKATRVKVTEEEAVIKKEPEAKAIELAKADPYEWNADNGCICDDWKGDSWSNDDDWTWDPWSEDSWKGDSNDPQIGWSEDGWDFNHQYKDVLSDLRADILQLIDETDRDLVPKCLRLAFHDCLSDECDGCIDPNEFDNRGLDEPIDLLFPLVQKYQHTLSRADVWAYCAVVSADAAVVHDRPKDLQFNMHFVGRKDCKDADKKGYGGPKVEMYDAHLTTHGMVDFFYDRFGFNKYETVVLMGAHSAAVAHRENIGFGNIGLEDGWVEEADKYHLSSKYYKSMLEHVWELQKVPNKHPVPGRYQWYFDEEDIGPIMLTVDMSLIVDVEGFVITDKKGTEGLVMCRAHTEAEFEIEKENIDDDPKKIPVCPMAKQTRWIVEELAEDNTKFLFSFVAVLNKMLTKGYGVYEHMQMGKSGKMGKVKSGKNHRNLDASSSEELDEHSSYSSRDTAKPRDSAQLKQRYNGNNGKEKWCPCHNRHKPMKPTAPTYYPTYKPTESYP